MSLLPSHIPATHAAPIHTRDDDRVVILDSYPPWSGWQLHCLTVPAEYRCDRCGLARESAMVATGEDTLICPACYTQLSRAATPTELPEQRTAQTSCEPTPIDRTPRHAKPRSTSEH